MTEEQIAEYAAERIATMQKICSFAPNGPELYAAWLRVAYPQDKEMY